ncbi:glycogen/starch/alpha-glucan phosphorylase [Primorskyibacter aestuariivivens]|uniref:glycogen/starch/alpha-glucan phosphorylase n=1 Tax=Primorskyibacter aestuariivivens TaxID=1888912 RepID=UPI0023008ADC|nr:glycogen/starch/alpha-glucan phosphorylase [Primorskyibacter aestuariivivens]MDA7427572.1 glycogen/starch/alpha-glucan phosphorylase [Primorskyibacter aestuariivivens]
MIEPNQSMMQADALQSDISRHLKFSLGKDAEHASLYDWRVSVSLALRDRVVEPWFASTRKTYEGKHKRVCYLSMEFLIGRLIEDVMINLGVQDQVREALSALGQDYDAVVADEPDAALGNGGLGRLAACFMDSLSTLEIPAYGYGIRYEHGLFEQHFSDGQQMEIAERWLEQRHVWEFERPEVAYEIGFGGHVSEEGGKPVWTPGERVLATAFDTPTVGWKGKWANTLRLWDARPVDVFDLASFNRGDYVAANTPERLARTITRVLYPDDTTESGKELRLKQEYFFTAASIQDLLRRFLSEGYDIAELPDHVAIQLNDTHPAIAGPELVRLLVDTHGLEMDAAIDLARETLAYTNHTLLPEALEAWPEDLFGRILPRHLDIIRAIQDRHLRDTGSDIRILDHGNVRMGELAFIMAHKVNGVSALHSGLVRETVFADLDKLYPDRIVNQTNGITPRRWLYSCNPALRDLITDTIGTKWHQDLAHLADLEPHLDDAGFQEAFRAAKTANKDRLAAWLKARHDVSIDTSALFDVQIKRIHEYKRQHLNILETIALWAEIRDNPNGDWTPRVKLFGGKAAPGYVFAKSIIRLINDVARTINADPVTRELLQVVYPENYNVSMAELLIPASDLSEQISTAGKEASGTGNMKLSLNGSPTIGTLDGANVEIRDHVGEDNFFLFGLTAAEAQATREEPGFSHRAIAASPRLQRALGLIAQGVFSDGDTHRYDDILHNLHEHDYFLVTCDFDDYFAKQREVDRVYQDTTLWTRMAAANTARMGWFSSDRTIAGYARDIWNVESVNKA